MEGCRELGWVELLGLYTGLIQVGSGLSASSGDEDGRGGNAGNSSSSMRDPY